MIPDTPRDIINWHESIIAKLSKVRAKWAYDKIKIHSDKIKQIELQEKIDFVKKLKGKK